MEFCWVTLHVEDFDKSLAFYTGLLGLPVSSKIERPGMAMAMLGPDDMPKVEIIHHEGESHAVKGGGISVGFRVDSLDDTMEYLKDHDIPILRGPISPGPNARFLYIIDPDGFEVQLVETR